MSSNVKSFTVGYNPINENNTFTSGDYITGQVTLELANECEINSLCVKLKGKAEAKWTENHGKTTVTYYSKEKYFSIKQFPIEGGHDKKMVGQGSNVYPFTFQIPQQDLPPSFKGSWGKIVYTLEAKLSRSMRLDSKANAKFTLIQNRNLNSDLSLMTPQSSTTEKKMKLFTSGTVHMDVNVERLGFHQGEGIKVVTSIQNRSSRDIRPKYCLYQKCSYFAKGKRKVQTNDILKEVGDAVPPSAGQSVTRVITIPPTTGVSILNCNIVKVEYRLRVYLDVKYASDPEVKLPIIILPVLRLPEGEHMPAYPPYGSGAFAGSYMPGGTGFPQNPPAADPSAPAPSYGTYGMYPPLTNFHGKS